MSIQVTAEVMPHEIDHKRCPLDAPRIVVKSAIGKCVYLHIADHIYEICADDLIDALMKCRS